jgi:beta-glucosidase
MTRARFPDGFLWGAATSAPQIEGGRREDGRADSIWDRFAEEPGTIADGSTPTVACDHYHRWREDVGLLEWLGARAYRFSISWPRILPTGHSRHNSRGLDFYDSLVDELLARGIRPFVTLNHWDVPQALQDQGGWVARSTTEAFVEYAEVVARRLGDRVKDWVTHNEPWCIATLGYEEGAHAPGHHDPRQALAVSHHLLLSHGWATREIRRMHHDARIGMVLNLYPIVPAAPTEDDRNAVRQLDGLFNRWYLEPLYNGVYPQDAIRDRCDWGHLDSPSLPFLRPGDLETIATPTDFLGVNYYTRIVARKGANGRPEGVRVAAEEELTDMGWEVYPEGLYDLLMRLQRDYRPPRVFITENGCAYGEAPDGEGRIRDERRIRYVRQHLLEALRARQDGVPLDGYFLWSLLDNFEWGEGYSKRFGIFWVDYETQKRLPKNSAHWYRHTIVTNLVQDQPDPATGRVS